MKRLLTLMALALTAGVGIASITGFSSASFVSASSNTSTVTAASDWTPPTVSIASPAFVRGTVTITATASDNRSGLASVQLQARPAGASTWTTLCAPTAAPFSCAWNTSGLTNGSYDLRAIATDKADNSATSSTVSTVVDNLAPTITLTDPGSPLRGTVTLTSSAADTHSGVASVAYQVASSATGTFTTVATATTAPWSASWDTTSIPSGTRHLRAVVTDKAGNTTTSAVVGPRTIDNTNRTVTLTDPGAYLEGTVTLTASATSTATITSVAIQRAPAGSGTWTTICTDTATPFTCPWNTTTVTDGSYDLRAVLTDANGSATSNVVTGRTVDNTTTVLKAQDVQTTNGGTAGRVDKGDQIVLTYSRRVDLATITPGWNGSSTPIGMTIDRGFLGLGTDTLLFTGAGANLGSIRTGTYFGNLLGGNITFDATMTATTELHNGVPRTVVTVTIGDVLTNARSLGTITTPSTLGWTPSNSVFGLNGQRVPATAVNESGANDVDF